MARDIISRRGDGRVYTTSKSSLMDDVLKGAGMAVDFGGVPELKSDDAERIVDILSNPNRIVGVEPGNEVVLSEDGGPVKIMIDSGGSGNGLQISRMDAILVNERLLGFDSFQLGHNDYSIKPVKPLIYYEMQAMEQIQLLSTVPMFYGAMPNMGLYYAPDGPFENPIDLMREGKIEEGMEQAEKAADQLSMDTAFVATKMMEVGTEGFNFDTTASAGDAEFVAALKGCKKLRDAYPNAYIEMGMASETVLGIHGSIEYDGQTVAGMYPHEQVKIAEKAGVNVFGPVVNTNSSETFAWNLGRAVTLVKECERVSNIPCHVNMGMGVGGIPVSATAVDAVTRASKAMVEIAKVDGI